MENIAVLLPSNKDLGTAPDQHTYMLIFTFSNYIVVIIRDETRILENPGETPTERAIQMVILSEITPLSVKKGLKRQTSYSQELCDWLEKNILHVAAVNGFL